MNLITADLLTANEACQDQVELFKKTFPNGAKLNRRNLAKAIKADLDVACLEELLPAELKARFEAVEQPAWEQLETAMRAAFEQYKIAKQSAKESAWEEYETAKMVPWNRYQAACGEALLKLLKQV